MVKEGFGKLATLGEALAIIRSVVGMKARETVQLEKANGRILAEDIIAAIDVPHFRRAAMDGYAVIAEDTFTASNTSPISLRLVDSITAGMAPGKELQHGDCIEITTGAPMPKTANAVLMCEYTEKKETMVTCYKAVTPGENIIGVGSDIKKRSTVFITGTQLNPRYLGVLASIGIRALSVSEKPIVTYFSTGNEVVGAGDTLTEGKIYDINSRTIVDTLLEHSCDVRFHGIVKDDLGEIQHTILRGAKEADIVLLSGGSSLGGEDYMVEAVRQLGEVLVHGIAAKPGKPVLIGKVNDTLVLGLPGYPTSALSNVYVLVLPAIYHMQGSQYVPVKTRARLTRKVASTIGRYEFLAVRLIDEQGELCAVPVMKGSSAITTLAHADGYIGIDENTEVVNKDTVVEVNLF